MKQRELGIYFLGIDIFSMFLLEFSIIKILLIFMHLQKNKILFSFLHILEINSLKIRYLKDRKAGTIYQNIPAKNQTSKTFQLQISENS